MNKYFKSPCNLEYLVEHTHCDNKTIQFNITNYGSLLIDVAEHELWEVYITVNPFIYFMDINGILIKLSMPYLNRILSLNNNKYYRIKQWQYDWWMSENDPQDNNGKLYNLIQNKIKSS